MSDTKLVIKQGDQVLEQMLINQADVNSLRAPELLRQAASHTRTPLHNGDPITVELRNDRGRPLQRIALTATKGGKLVFTS